MWFKMPEGAGGISVERQQFRKEWTDPAGNNYFRAPSHFSPQILAIKGFSLAGEIPPGAPDDLPISNPATENAIAGLASTVDAQGLEIQNMRSSLIAMQKELDTKTTELTTAEAKLTSAEEKIVDLEDELAELQPEKKG